MAPVSSRRRVGRGAVAVLAVVCASVVVSHMFGRFSYSLLLTAITGDLVGSFTGAGFLGASYFAGYLLGVVGVTAVSARAEPVVLLRTGLGLSALALATIAVAPTFGVLASGLFFAGLAGAGIWIPAPAIAASGIPADRRGLVMGALTASMGIGMLVISQGTNLYRSFIGNDGAWREIFGTEALVTVAIFIAAMTVVGREHGAGEQVSPPVGDRRSALFDLAGLRSIRGWKQLTAAYTVFAVLAGSWTQFLGVAMKEDAGYSETHISWLYSTFAIAGTAGPLAIGRLSDRIGRDRGMVIACGLAALASAMLTLGTEPWTALAAVAFGVGSFSVPPLTAAAVGDELEGREFATAFGAMTILYAIASMAASQVAGMIADATGGFDTVYLLLASAAAVSAGASYLRSRPQSLVGR